MRACAFSRGCVMREKSGKKGKRVVREWGEPSIRVLPCSLTINLIYYLIYIDIYINVIYILSFAALAVPTWVAKPKTMKDTLAGFKGRQ